MSTDAVTELKDSLRTRRVRGLALDIDETLSDSNAHWFEHMFRHHPFDGMDRDAVIRNQRFVEDVPEWGTPEARAFIGDTLHSNEFQEDIPLVEGADEGVRSLHTAIPIVAYITARPVQVRAGTETWLRKHGFPDASLIMRDEKVNLESHSDQKNRWKIGVLQTLWPEVVGIVDDNMGLAHELERAGYEGTVFLYGPQHEVFKGHPRVAVCPTWPDVVRAVHERLTK